MCCEPNARNKGIPRCLTESTQQKLEGGDRPGNEAREGGSGGTRTESDSSGDIVKSLLSIGALVVL